MTYQTMEDLAKRGGGDAAGVMDPAMRERMWATMQAKQALREALQNTPSAGRGGAALDPEDDDDAGRETEASPDPTADPEETRASLRNRWKTAKGDSGDVAGSAAGASASGSVAGSVSARGKRAETKSSVNSERTVTTSSMRRHRAGKKEKAAKAARLASYAE